MNQNTIRLPRILLTNDDGIDAPGLAVLRQAAQFFSDEIWVIAPESDKSGTSQSITLCEPIYLSKRSPRDWAVRGNPADCVAVAVNHFMKENPPSLILSGVNSGANTGDENCLSGTLGAALMGLMLGVPSIAISQQCEKREDTPWATTRTVLPQLLQHFLTEGWRKETCLSVNIPICPPEEITGLSWARQAQKNIHNFKFTQQTSPRGNLYGWLTIDRAPAVADNDSDIAILSRKKVAVTAIGLDRSVEVVKPPITMKNLPNPIGHE